MQTRTNPSPSALIVWIASGVLFGSLGSGSASAQSDPPKQTGSGTPGLAPKKKPEMEFELSPEMRAETDSKGATPDGLVIRLKRDLGRYPGAAGKRAVAEVVANGQPVIPPLRALLEGFEFPPRIGAAIALGQLNDVPSAPRVAAILDDKRCADHAPALFEVVYRLSVDEGDRAALTHANSRVREVRSAALVALAQHLRPELTPGLRSLLGSEQEKTRQEAFTMLDRLSAPGLEVEALHLLGDNSAAVNVAAKNWLAKNRTDAMVSELLAQAQQDPPTRQALWALLTLAEMEERFGVALFREEMIPLLTPRLRSLDKLVRLSAAIALSHVAARSPNPDSETLLASQVVPAFMDTYLSGEYFKDALPLLDMSATRLSRLTGVELGTDLTRWREAWLGGGATPRIRRDLDPKQIAEGPDALVIHYRRSGTLQTGLDRDIVFISEAMLASSAQESETDVERLYVPKAIFAELAALLVAKNVLSGRATTPERVGTTGFRALRVSLDNRERSAVIAAGASATDPDFEAAETRILEISDLQAWQRLYVGPRAQFAEWYHQQSTLIAAATDSSARATQFVSSFGLAASGLDAKSRCRFLSVLLRDPEPMRIEDIQILIQSLSDESVIEGPWMVLAAVVNRRGSEEAFKLFLEQVAAKFGTEGIPHFAGWIEARSAVSTALASTVPVIRMAALEAALEHPGVIGAAELIQALSDADARARRAAVFALAVHPDAAARREVVKIASDPTAPLVRVALEACGSMPAEEVLEVLAAAAANADDAIFTAATRGYARMPLGAGIPKLLEIAESDATTPERQGIAYEAVASTSGGSGLGAYAITTGGATSAATDGLRRALTKTGGPQRLAIAYLAAQRLDVQAAPVLIEALENDSKAERARDALEMLFCTDGGDRGEQFTLRWNQNAERSADDWFAIALEGKGMRIGTSLPLETLLEACKDDRWYVRHGSIVRLAQRFGVAIASPGRFGKQEQIDKVARRFAGLAYARACGA